MSVECRLSSLDYPPFLSGCLRVIFVAQIDGCKRAADNFIELGSFVIFIRHDSGPNVHLHFCRISRAWQSAERKFGVERMPQALVLELRSARALEPGLSGSGSGIFGEDARCEKRGDECGAHFSYLINY